MKIFNYLKKIAYKYKLLLSIFLLVNILVWGINTLTYSLLGNYIDVLIKENSINSVYNFSIKVVILTLSLLFLSYIGNITQVKLTTQISYDINYGLIRKIKKSILNSIETSDPSYLSQKIYNDSSTVAAFFVNNVLNLVVQIINIAVILFLMIYINANMMMIVTLFIPTYFLVYIKFKKPLYYKGFRLKEKQNDFFSVISRQLQNLKFIKLNSFYEETDMSLNENFKAVYKETLELAKVTSLFSISGSIFNNIFQVILIFYGGMQIINGNMSVGQFTIINSYFSTFMTSIKYLLQFGQSYQDFLVSFNRISDVENLREDNNGNISMKSINKITVENLSFGYDSILFMGYSHEFIKGKIYCVKGENGTGKSSFLSLIMGVYHNYSGIVYYNDIDIRKLDMYNIRKNNLGISEQFPYLINDTIFNNLVYSRESYNRETVLDYVHLLNLETLIDKYNNGIDSIINYNNDNISGGEKQKIALIRLLLKNPDVLILDEPSASLDSSSVMILSNLLVNLKKNKIIIIVSHDKRIMEISDEIIELSQESLALRG